MSPTLLVVAKAPIPGQVKTRLAHDLGGQPEHFETAAEIASASLLDTLDVCASFVGAARCRLALEGCLDDAVRGDELRHGLRGWTVVPQCDGALGHRLAHALAAVPGPVIQIGMDTPQVSAALLRDLSEQLDAAGRDGVLGPALDGGWWALGLRNGRDAAPLRGVPMSTPSTYVDTRAALEAAGLSVAVGPTLGDVDHARDLKPVAALVPGTRFAEVVANAACGEMVAR